MGSFDDLMDELHQAAKIQKPTAEELAASPKALDWMLVKVLPGVLVLVGNVVGHPLLPDGPVRTSLLRAASIEAGWVRTNNRIYRLGFQREQRHRSAFDPLVAEIRSIVGTIAVDEADFELELWAQHGAISADADGMFSSPNFPTGRLPPMREGHANWTIDRRLLVQLALRVASARAQRWRADEQRLLPMPETWREALRLHGSDRFEREVSVGAGWVDLALTVDAWLIELGQATGWDQVIQKNGSMILHPATEVSVVADEIIQHAETLSQSLCETCGAPGRQRDRHGWIYTSCAEHQQQ